MRDGCFAEDRKSTETSVLILVLRVVAVCVFSSPFCSKGFGEKARISSLEKLKLQEIFSDGQRCLCHRRPSLAERSVVVSTIVCLST